MNPLYFTRFELSRVGFQEVVQRFLLWTLGVGAYSRLRARRRKSGLKDIWTAAEVAKGGHFLGNNDFDLDTRRDERDFLLRFRHRDAEEPGVLWWTVARLQDLGTATQVELALARSGPRSMPLPLLSRPPRPRIIADLIEEFGSQVVPNDLSRLYRLTGCDAADAVQHLLLDPKRALPLVAVSARRDDGEPVVDPAQLSSWVDGMAMVASLADDAASRAWTEALRRKNFVSGYFCFDGSIRIYRPNLTPSKPSPRIAPETILEQSEPDRLPYVAAEISRRMVRTQLPDDFFTLIEAYDQAASLRHARALLMASKASEGLAENAKLRVEELQRRMSEMETAFSLALDQSEQEKTRLEKEHREAEEKLFELEIQMDEAHSSLEERSRELSQKAVVISELQGRLEELKSMPPTEMPLELREALMVVMQGEKLRPRHYLAFSSALFSDRLRVLPEATKTVPDSDEFFRPDAARELLYKLATQYFSVISSGKGDTEARKVFGRKEFASTESDRVANSKGASKRRTFLYKGEQVEMLAHLKAGNGESKAGSLRIHFLWDAEDKLIVIGHCGPHLNFF